MSSQKKNSPHTLGTTLESEVYQNMLRTSVFLTHKESMLLKQYGLSRTQYQALCILREEDKTGIPVLELAQHLISRIPDITRLVDRLAASCLVRRVRSHTDRRRVLVRVNNRALTLLAKIDKPIQQLTQGYLGHLSRRERQTLNKLLLKARATSD